MRQYPNGGPPQSGRVAAGMQLARSGLANLGQHWMLAGFSLVAAFGIWFVVQDVENPRVQTLVPPDPEPPSIPVTVANNSNDYIVDDPPPVQLKVEGRKNDLSGLRPEDFTAEVDIRDQAPGDRTLPVRITKAPAGVRVVEVKPALVTVSIHPAETKELRVNARVVSPLPQGYAQSDDPTIDPVTVTIRGIPELVDSVATVDVDANLGGVTGNFSFDGDLVAHTAGGNPVTVTITPPRAHVTYRIQQEFVSKTIGFANPAVGIPAPGYRIASITFDPPVVTATGPKSVIDGLTAAQIEQINVNGAKTDVVGTHPVQIPNVIVDRNTVLVRIEIKPVDCSDQTPGPCTSASYVVAPTFTNVPPGLRPDGIYTVTVRLSGPITQFSTLKVSDVRAAVNLAGATAGTAPYAVKVTVPAGFTADADPLSVTLVTNALP